MRKSRAALFSAAVSLLLGIAVNVYAADPPITVTVFSAESGAQTPAANNKIYKLIQDKFGITFQWDIAVGEKDQKIGTMIASGDYDDILHIDSNKFIDAGALVPLEDMINKYAPNIKKHYAAIWEKIKEKDGHIYALPNYGVIQGKPTSTGYYGPAMFIQKAVLKEFNYPKIKTVDEYFDLIAKYKAKYPTIDGKPTIGFSILTYDWHVFDLVNPPQFLAGYPNDGNGVVNRENNTYRVHLGLDIAKRWFKKLNDMNTLGLVDRESFVDNYDQYMAKLAQGRVLGVHDQYWQFQDSQFPLISAGNISRTMAPLPIVFDKNTRPWWRDRALPNLQRAYGISVKAKDPVRLLKFMDAQLSEEWQKIFQWGIQGQDYALDAKGVPYRTPEQRKQQDDPTWKLSNKADLWWGDAPKLEGTYSDGNAVSIGDIPGEFLANLKPDDRELLKAYGVSSYAELMDPNPPENPVYYPAWQINITDGSDAQIAWNKATDVFRKDLPKAILAKSADFEGAWTNYLNDLAKTNLKAFEAVIQAGINDRIKQWTPKK